MPNTIRQLVREGYTAARCECRCSQPPIARDLFNFADVMGVKTMPDLWDEGDPLKVVLVQVTSASNMSTRKKKVAEKVSALGLNHRHLLIECWGWKQAKLHRREALVDGQWRELL